jgi:hypothetical protein
VAVGGFSAVAQGGQAELTSAMHQVTGGLATAFDTTLVALIMAVILLFPMESLRRTEYRMLDRIEQFSNDSLLRRMGSEQDGISVEEMPVVVRDALQSAFGQHQKWLVQWQGQVAQLGQIIGGDFEAAVSRIHEKMVAEEGARLNRLQDLSKLIDDLFEKTCQNTRSWHQGQEQSAGQIQGLLEATQRLEHALSLVAERAGSTAPSASPQFAQQMERLEQQIARLADAVVAGPAMAGNTAVRDLVAHDDISRRLRDGDGHAASVVPEARRSMFKFW